MFCKWCGLESDTSDVCSWCQQPFAAPASPAPAPAKPEPESVAPAPPPAAPAPKPTFRSAMAELEAFDDDFSPIPFAPIAPPPPSKPAQQPPAIVPAASAPEAAATAPVTARSVPPAAAPRTPEDRPDLKAIPIKRTGSAPPPVIPISKAPAPPPEQVKSPPAAAPPPEPEPIPIAAKRAPLVEEPAEDEAPTPPIVQEEPPDQPPPILEDKPLDQPVGEEPQIGAAPARPERVEPEVVRSRPVQQPQPAAAATATVARAPARVYCRWCGMESDTPDICSWCHKDIRFQPTARPVEALRRGPEPVIKKGPHRTPVKPAAAPPAEGNGHGANPGVPALGTFTAAKSRYYPDKVYDPVSGAHYDADTGEAELPRTVLEEELEPEVIYPLNQLAVNVAILVGLAVIGALMVQRQPAWYLTLLGVTNFAAGMVMPLLGTVPFGEDDSSDIGVVIGLILVLGPLVGCLLYFFICVVKQDFSPAMVGVFVSYLILRFALDMTAGVPIAKVMPWTEFTPETVGAQIMPFVTIAGWYAAGMFHKPDE